MNHLESLNQKQHEAVLATEGPVLIVAGAGTGKTKTLTHRMYHLIHQGIHPEKILAITFTNKAAKEMRERVLAMLDKKDEFPMVKTFHSLGVYILRRFSREAGLIKNFTILDATDSLKLIKEAMERHSINPKLHEPKKIRSIISSKKGEGITPDQFTKTIHSALSEVVALVWSTYEELKHREFAVDFDDLLLKTRELLEKNSEVRTLLQKSWNYIHVDEYQDTNRVQYDLIKILADQHKNICVVGDTDQNIYSWRGANLRNILNFEKDYPEAHVILLEENYRSTKNILTAADEVIRKNTARIPKTLFTRQHEGEKIRLSVALNEIEEAQTIAQEAKSLVQQGNYDIAVLYRTNFQSRVLEEAFMQSGVPYQLLGTKFFERKEIKDVISYIRASKNSEGLSDIKRIINEPKRGLGPAAIAKIFSGQITLLSPAQSASYQKFLDLLQKIKDAGEHCTPAELVRFVIETTGFFDLYKQGSEDERERLLNLEELVTYATKYENLDIMLEDIALQSDQDELDAHERQEGVKLMTIHASKGLEFDQVFISGLEQGLFPHDGFDEKNSVEDQEEERRLFYVAITRARKKLFLSYAMMRTIYGQQTFNEPSEFLQDIPDEIIEKNEPNGPLAPLKTVYLE